MQNFPQDTKLEIVRLTLEGHARALNLPGVPVVLLRAKPDVFDALTLDLTSFLVFYAHRWELGEITNTSKLFREWQDLTGSSLYLDYTYRLINQVFYRQILCPAAKAIPTRRFGMIRSRKNNGFYEDAVTADAATDAAPVCV